MSHVEDTQIKDGQYKPGTLLEDGKWRVEIDSMGQVKMPADRLWGAQTQRSLIHFSIGNDHMPLKVYHAYGVIGYDNASKIAHTAQDDGTTLREAARKTGLIDEKKFDEVVNPQEMVGDTTLTFSA